ANIRRSMAHPLAELQALAGKILLVHQTPVEELPDEVINNLIESSASSARVVGVELFGKLPDKTLLERHAMLANLCTSPQEDIRRTVKSIVGRLARKHPDFARDMVLQCYPLLARKEGYDGLHGDLYQLMAEHLEEALGVIPVGHIFKLLNSRYEHAQQLGALLMKTGLDLKTLPLRRLVQLAGHEMADVRAMVRTHYDEQPDRIKAELEEAVRLVDCPWEETRDFAFDYFRERLDESDWTPEILVSLCDSVNRPVQAFGRDLVTRFFREENGPVYLLKFSQHPSGDLQLFATHYLERFAAGHPERLNELELFFITVLSRANRGRVAKDRVLRFLLEEGLKDAGVAKLVAGILTRVSATMAIGDKTRCVAGLRQLAEAWPDLETPFVVREPELIEVEGRS
ncbi:MAG: hypothetical protein AAF492_07675, partial [Verrucomicrobiota bacterium]